MTSPYTNNPGNTGNVGGTPAGAGYVSPETPREPTYGYLGQSDGGATAVTPQPVRSASGYDTTDHARRTDDRSIGEIVSDLSSNFSTLMRQEVALAKAEAQQEVARLGKGAGMLGGAAIAAIMMLTFLSLGLWWWIAISIGNHDHPALGWAGLIVGILYAIVAGILASVGRSQLKRAQPNLPQTTDTVSKIPNALKGDEEENR